MEWRPRFRRARFALQPWRYEFEYARAWREADFALFTLASPTPHHRRFGGKGRGGRLPRRPFHRLPMWLWSDLYRLEAIESGDDWEVRISSQRKEFSAATHLSNASAETDLEHLDIVVDGRPIEYCGTSIAGVWRGAPVRAHAPIVEITGLQPESVALATITDPGDHLRKQG